MRKFIYTLFVFVFLSSVAFGQSFEDGKYLFKKNNLLLTIEVCDSGWVICSFTLEENRVNIVNDLRGEWFKVNMNGVDEDYDGPEGWYQIDSGNKSFEIDYLSSREILLIWNDKDYKMYLVD